ncbi:MAG TPA: glycosyltransferase family 2 protein [Longimicrobiales bacterium]|nr:glycosyltransferase family 2 protein [Longimicrobiales bacterium]
MSVSVPLLIIGLALALFVYAYLGYPLALWLLSRVRNRPLPRPDGAQDWPTVSISVPAYNEAAQIRELILSLLALDYPRDRMQIVVVSDCSDDGTDDIVREYADQGVELLRVPERGGKNKAENYAAGFLTGDIVVNTDASIRIHPGALKPLVAVFRDPGIGCASGRDISVGPGEDTENAGESGYVGYEMGIRDLETRVSGIIGASGCFYAIRPHLHRLPLPESLSRDFSAALHSEEHGFRAVSVPEATCLVPRSPSLRKEYRRKVRTITRGLQTLWYKRFLLNPFRHGWFAWMLFSHKICRWLLPWAGLAAFLALGVLALSSPLAAVAFGAGAVVLVLAAAGWLAAGRGDPPRLLSIPAFLVAGNVAAAHAFLRALRGGQDKLWEPTRRHVVKAG